MDIIKIIGIGLISLIIIVILRQYKPEYAMYVSLTAGVLIFSIIAAKMSGIIEILKNLSSKASINNGFIMLLIKITGIAILTEFAVSVCKDSGENSIASKVDLGRKSNNNVYVNSNTFKPNGNNYKNITLNIVERNIAKDEKNIKNNCNFVFYKFAAKKRGNSRGNR